MTLELVDLDRAPGYAGPLHAIRSPALANRFHFWRGASGRRYACTRFPANRPPAYEDAVALFVRRRGGSADLLGLSAAPGCPIVPLGTEEIHLHIAGGGAEALAAAIEDLSLLVTRPQSNAWAERRAA